MKKLLILLTLTLGLFSCNCRYNVSEIKICKEKTIKDIHKMNPTLKTIRVIYYSDGEFFIHAQDSLKNNFHYRSRMVVNGFKHLFNDSVDIKLIDFDYKK